MKFYVVFGVLAALALHALAEETKESSAATVVAAASTPIATKSTVLGNYNDSILGFFNQKFGYVYRFYKKSLFLFSSHILIQIHNEWFTYIIVTFFLKFYNNLFSFYF